MKKFLAILCICVFLLTSFSAFATDSDKLITEANFYTAKIYYCDATQGKIVLTEVAPKDTPTNKTALTAQMATYNEISVYGTLLLPSGEVVDLHECNRYPDSNVEVLITKDASGELSVLSIKLL